MDYRYYYERSDRDERPLRPRLRLAAAASAASAVALAAHGLGSGEGLAAALLPIAALASFVVSGPVARLAAGSKIGPPAFAAG